MAKHTVRAPEMVHTMNLERERNPQGPWIISVSIEPNPTQTGNQIICQRVAKCKAMAFVLVVGVLVIR